MLLDDIDIKSHDFGQGVALGEALNSQSVMGEKLGI